MSIDHAILQAILADDLKRAVNRQIPFGLSVGDMMIAMAAEAGTVLAQVKDEAAAKRYALELCRLTMKARRAALEVAEA